MHTQHSVIIIGSGDRRGLHRRRAYYPGREDGHYPSIGPTPRSMWMYPPLVVKIIILDDGWGVSLNDGPKRLQEAWSRVHSPR